MVLITMLHYQNPSLQRMPNISSLFLFILAKHLIYVLLLIIISIYQLVSNHFLNKYFNIFFFFFSNLNKEKISLNNF